MMDFRNVENMGMSYEEVLTPEDLGVTRNETELSNGTKLVMLEKPNAPVNLRAIIFGGQRFDPVGKEGTAHFLEHMLVACTKKFPSKDKLAAHIEQYGGGLGASTSNETLIINSSVADPRDIGLCTEVMHEMLLEPLFDPRIMEMERSAILKELGDKKSNPTKMLWELYPTLFFKGQDRGRSILGSESTINSITRDDLLDFYSRAITSGRLTLLACGGVGVNTMKEFAERDLIVPEGQKLNISNQVPIDRETPILVEQFPGDQVHLFLGFRTDSCDESENIALNIIANALGGGRSSILQKELRYERGLTYGVGSFTFKESDTGVFLIKTSTSKDSLQKVLDVISDEVRRITDNGLAMKDMELTKMKMIKSLRMNLQDSENWVNMYTDWERGVGAPLGITAYTQGISSCTTGIIKSVAQKYFAKDKWYLGMCGDVSVDQVKVNL